MTEAQRGIVRMLFRRQGWPEPKLVVADTDLAPIEGVIAPGIVDRRNAVAIWRETLYPTPSTPAGDAEAAPERLFVRSPSGRSWTTCARSKGHLHAPSTRMGAT